MEHPIFFMEEFGGYKGEAREDKEGLRKADLHLPFKAWQDSHE